MTVVMSIDRCNVWPLMVSVFSLASKSTVPFSTRIYLTEDVSDMDRDCLTIFLGSLSPKISTFSLLDAPILGDEVTKGHLSAASFARMRILDSVSDKFIWLDADTVAVGPWSPQEILGYLSSKFIAAAVPYPPSKEELSTPAGKRNRSYAKAGEQYFNAGVMAIDGKRWGEGKIWRHWPEANQNRGELGFIWPTNCLLNYVLSGKVSTLPKRFNVISDVDLCNIEVCTIVHFAGNRKPWHSRPFWEGKVPSWQIYNSAESNLLAHLEALDIGRKKIKLIRKIASRSSNRSYAKEGLGAIRILVGRLLGR